MGEMGGEQLNLDSGWDLGPPLCLGEGTGRSSRCIEQKFNKNDREQGFLLPSSLGFGVSGWWVVACLCPVKRDRLFFLRLEGF